MRRLNNILFEELAFVLIKAPIEFNQSAVC